MIREYVFRIQAADWDFGDIDVTTGAPGPQNVGIQKVVCYHQFVDAQGVAVPLTDPTGAWEPFIPGPEIRGNVGDEIHVTVQNRIEDPSGDFVDSLKTGAIVHWHGIELANAHDGTPVTQKPIASGQDFVYRFTLERPGIFWYHPHFNGLVQEHLGCYGAIIVEDPLHTELRAAKVIPHEDRTFRIGLSDVSFQNGPASDPPAAHVPLANIPGAISQLYIRDILNIQGFSNGAENLGDVHLINGLYNKPFNSPNSNFQQFWPDGERQTAAPIVANEGESFAFQIFNMGLHRFYKIQLAFSTVANPSAADWQVSNDLFWIGGQGGLLDEARSGGGDFDQWRIRGRKQREVAGGGQGTTAVQNTSELSAGEFLLPTSARIMLAFAIGAGWQHVALRVSGFSVQNGTHTADETPTDMEIARFSVSTTVDDTFKLTTDIADGTPLLTNSVLDSLLPPGQTTWALEDLTDGSITAVTSSPCTWQDLDDNDVPVTPIEAEFTSDYSPELTGGGTPSLDNESVHWMPTGPFQETPMNTRYVQLGDVVEWTVETRTNGSDHPWHMHGFSFQPVRMDLNTGSGYTTLYNWDFTEYVDSIYVPGNHRLTFRFRVEDRDYIGEDGVHVPNGGIGRWLAHCHITKHAHRGMMTNFIVVDNCDTQNFQHVDVYLRDRTTDTGAEPSTGGASGSPDIIMRDQPVADPAAAFGPGSTTENVNTLGNQAEAGNNNYLYVRANNRGTRPGIMTADLYWSEASTLLTPQNWNYIGTTDPMTVPQQDPNNPLQTLTVSDPAVVWEAADNPLASGAHACLIAVAGSEQDPKPITPGVAASFGAVGSFSSFGDFVRAHNNVAWRNFNVIDNLADSDEDEAEKSFSVIIRGAWDRVRLFDVVIQNPFEHAFLEMPFDERIARILQKQDFKLEVSKRRMVVHLPRHEKLRLANLPLGQDCDYRSRIVVREHPEKMIGHTLWIAQEHIDDGQDAIVEAKRQLEVLHDNLREIKDDREAEMAKNAIVQLERELEELSARAKNLDKAPREEMGRVTWLFTKKREEPKGGILKTDEKKPEVKLPNLKELEKEDEPRRLLQIIEELSKMLRLRM